MKSLCNFSEEKIISSLPQECLDKLFESYIEDKEYDLSTFVKTTTPPKNGYFIVLTYDSELQIDSDITGDVLSCCYRSMYRYTLSIISFKVYWIPERKLNEIIYCKDYLYNKRKIYITVKPHVKFLDKNCTKRIWTSLQILDETQVNIKRWNTRLADKVYTIQYFVPPNGVVYNT